MKTITEKSSDQLTGRLNRSCLRPTVRPAQLKNAVPVEVESISPAPCFRALYAFSLQLSAIKKAYVISYFREKSFLNDKDHFKEIQINCQPSCKAKKVASLAQQIHYFYAQCNEAMGTLDPLTQTCSTPSYPYFCKQAGGEFHKGQCLDNANQKITLGEKKGQTPIRQQWMNRHQRLVDQLLVKQNQIRVAAAQCGIQTPLDTTPGPSIQSRSKRSARKIQFPLEESDRIQTRIYDIQQSDHGMEDETGHRTTIRRRPSQGRIEDPDRLLETNESSK